MKRTLLQWFFILMFIISPVISNYACTIFILTDTKRSLFFNNEDYSNPLTHIWFLPGGKEYYGVAYVGFDNDWAQGGVNTAGLAFDWVAGFKEEYTPDENLLKVRGSNPGQRMLESCATIDEAIAFYQKYRESSFSYAKLMIADKTGASVIIGAKNGKLYFDKSNQSRGFGYGEKTLIPLLSKDPKPTFRNGLPILQACTQQGEFATKYSSIYDLRSGDIFLIPAGQRKEIKLNLSKELSKGEHYYKMADINRQLNKALLPIRPAMKRFISDGYTPIVNPDSTTDHRFRLLLENSASGNLKEEEFSTELWKQIVPNLKTIQEEGKKMGKIQSFTLLERKEINRQRSYLYLIEFETATVLQRFVLNEENRLSVLKSEGWEPRSK